jgi:DNA-binding winged helix-turn-helix (wHTH) protein/tetratricopeptide (TPR) repeat protein
MAGNRLLFGELELRLDSGELFRSGVPVKLQPQPARLLELLARRSGEVVSREELRLHLWGEDTFVDFEHGLNFSIRQLRRALGDAADAPRFVETIPRHGYRFLPAVRFETETPVPSAAVPELRHPLTRFNRWVSAATKALVILLLLALQPRPSTPPHRVPPEAWEAYSEGSFLILKGQSPGDLDKGIARLQRAVLLEPRFAAAYTALARAEEMAPDRLPFEKYPIIEAAARRAVELDPDQAQAHLVLARIHFLRDLDPWRAGREVERALRADPKLAEAYSYRGDYLAILGRHDEAIHALEQARNLDPAGELTNPDLLCFHFFLARRWDEAVHCGQRVAALPPVKFYDKLYAQHWVLNAAAHKGDVETALAAAQAQVAALASTFPPPERLRSLRDYWQWDLARLTTLARQRPLLQENLLLDHLALGERDRALTLLEKAFERRNIWYLPFLGVDPRFDDLRGDPRFERLLRRRVETPPPAASDSGADAASSPDPPAAGRGASANP